MLSMTWPDGGQVVTTLVEHWSSARRLDVRRPSVEFSPAGFLAANGTWSGRDVPHLADLVPLGIR